MAHILITPFFSDETTIRKAITWKPIKVIKYKEREESRLIAAQEKRDHQRLFGQVTKNVIGEGFGPGKGKSKTQQRKKKQEIMKSERDQKKFEARMERLEQQKMDNIEDWPDMDDYKYREVIKS